MEEKEFINEIIKNVSATLSFEGLEMSEMGIQLNKEVIIGKITSHEAREKIISNISLKNNTTKIKNDIEDTYQSSYCYNGTNIYKNNYDIKNKSLLDTVEADLTGTRLIESHLNPIKGNFRFKHFKKIHHYIFQDIYPFAGVIRTEDIMKGNTFFCKCSFIESSLNDLFNTLEEENFLKKYEFEDFISRLVYYIGELNMIHPFREGNGRSTREFIRLLAIENNYDLKWYETNPDEILNGVIKTVNFDYTLLEETMSKIIKKNR